MPPDSGGLWTPSAALYSIESWGSSKFSKAMLFYFRTSIMLPQPKLAVPSLYFGHFASLGAVAVCFCTLRCTSGAACTIGIGNSLWKLIHIGKQAWRDMDLFPSPALIWFSGPTCPVTMNRLGQAHSLRWERAVGWEGKLRSSVCYWLHYDLSSDQDDLRMACLGQPGWWAACCSKNRAVVTLTCWLPSAAASLVLAVVIDSSLSELV